MALVEDPSSAPTIRWGLLGTGWIADRFARAVAQHTRAQVVSVGSRNKHRGDRFATQHGIPGTHLGYEELVSDPHLDAIYVASPHSEHREHALMAIEAGKHLLVEKAFARNAAEAQDIVDAARSKGVFLMEAMWTRFLPHVAALRAVLARGEIGEVVHLAADHGQWFEFDPEHRVFNPLLAGGALLDLGVYPISFAHDLLGVPESVTATGKLTETGVDGQVSVVLTYPGRVQATLHTTLWSKTPTTAVIAGTEGRIEVAGDFYSPTSFTVIRNDGTRWTYQREVPIGLQYEAAEVARQVSAGATESPRLTWDNTLAVMRTMDEVRAQIGMVYPGE
jgi:predicted dehydrogenase